MSPVPTPIGGALDAMADALATALPGEVRRDVPASELGTYRVGGPVAVLVRAVDDDALARVSQVVHDHRPPVLVVGRGSNLLVADRGFAGLGVMLAGDFEAMSIAPDRTRVRAGGGVPLPVLARRTASAGVAGLEFFVGIPGSVGGAVRMNAGGHGRETRDVLVEARVRDLRRPAAGVVTRTVDELVLGYRTSAIGPDDVVVDAWFAAAADAPDACGERIDEIVRWRREHQPGGANGGSVFRNPPGDAAGRLIDASGCKGLRVGGAVVSDKHANFFQAEPGATADDVRRLATLVRERVAEATGVVLQTELVMVGFDEAVQR